MKTIIFVLVFALSLFFAFPLQAFSQKTKKIDKNLDNIAIQYAECAAYYELVYYAMKASDENKTANTYRQLENDAMLYSLLLANEGRSKDLAIEVTNARIDIYKKKMKHETDNRNEFVFGEKVNLVFNNVSGLTNSNGKTFPELSMYIVKNDID